MTEQHPDHIWQPFARPRSISEQQPVVLDHASGVWIYDKDGKRYLDSVGALESMAVGHGRKRIARVAGEQMEKLAFIDVFRYLSQPALDLAAELVRLTPPNMNTLHFSPGGSDAVEVALKLAIQYHWVRGDRDRRKVITREGAYHGVTFGAMNCDGRYWATRNDIYLGETRFGVVAEGPATGPNWGPGAAYAAGAEEFRKTIEREDPATVAAIIVDPLATASGVAMAPESDLQALREIADEFGILLIVDEVITGFARSGRMFATQLYDVAPDFMPMSKALGSGYLPIAATMISDRVRDTIGNADALPDSVYASGHTYGGHPVACAVALENLAIIEEEDLAARSIEFGEYLRAGLDSLSHNEVYVDSRGIGLLAGIEIQGDEFDWGKLGNPPGAALWIRQKLRDLGLITLTVHPGNVFLLAPPLIMDKSEIDLLVEMFDSALSLAADAR